MLPAALMVFMPRKNKKIECVFSAFFLYFSWNLVNLCLMSSCILLHINFFLNLAHDSAVFPKTASGVHTPLTSWSDKYL